MAIDDRLVVVLPEGVAVDLRLAGIASRGIATAVDLVLASLTMLALLAVVSLFGVEPSLSDWWLGAGPALAGFAIVVLWPAAWEVFNDGRTPGKVLLGLRVATTTGAPLTAGPTLVRNVLRVVDVLPIPYGVGLASAVVTAKGQRLGDLVAGTVVIREPAFDRAGLAVADPFALRWAAQAAWARTDQGHAIDPRVWDTGGLTGDELRLARRFLERRWSMTPALRAWMASEVAARVRPKVVGPPPDLPPEALVEGVVLGHLTDGRPAH